MSTINGIPSQILLYRTDSSDGHSTRPHGRATQSAFADYAFGPIDTHGNQSKQENKPVTGLSLAQYQTGAPSWVTQVQAASGVKG
ncbi:MAG: hypothetical protein M0006_07980 [Magnetospirillum sp.]|nr:hypothetical protein [Magnetospirillum sp.]